MTKPHKLISREDFIKNFPAVLAELNEGKMFYIPYDGGYGEYIQLNEVVTTEGDRIKIIHPATQPSDYLGKEDYFETEI